MQHHFDLHPSRIKRLVSMLMLGFSSGLPLALVSGTLLTWYTKAGVAITTIGLLTFIRFAYFFKFLWAPFLDRIHLPLGRRRGWMLLMQVCLIITLWILAGLDPKQHTFLMASVAMLAAICAATQDIAINAYQTDCLTEQERGLGAALYVGGYRVAMLVSGGLALIIAARWGWAWTYRCMAMLMFVGVACSFWVREPEDISNKALTYQQAIVAPFLELFRRKQALRLLIFICLYKLSEAFSSATGTGVINAFLIRQLHFTLIQIGVVNKMVGFVAIMAGMFVGGVVLTKIKLSKALFWFGVIQVIANSSFFILTLVPKHIVYLGMAVCVENFSGGLVTAAILALIMASCHQRFSASQFALLSALATMGATLVGPATGYIIAVFGWRWFFMIGIIVAIFPLFIIPQLRTGRHC